MEDLLIDAGGGGDEYYFALLMVGLTSAIYFNFYSRSREGTKAVDILYSFVYTNRFATGLSTDPKVITLGAIMPSGSLKRMRAPKFLPPQ